MSELLMAPVPRRPLDDGMPCGYLESDVDYVLNNLDVAVALLDTALLRPQEAMIPPADPT